MARPVLERMASKYDNYLYDLIKKGGEIVRDGVGNIVMDKNGKPLRQLTPAMLTVIERRMHHGGVSLAGKVSNDKSLGSTFRQLQQQVTKANIKNNSLKISGSQPQQPPRPPQSKVG